MKIDKFKYPGLESTLLYLKEQVRDSLPFARKFLQGEKRSLIELFNLLKGETIYINDPHRIELLQSMQTLFTEDNQHHIYGAGDCDCFTIAALASLWVSGYKNLQVALAGRNPYNPAHIYVVVDGVPFDLTNNRLGKERPYKYIQYIPFSL